MNVDELIKNINSLYNAPNKIFVIAISGFGGSGKSTLSDHLSQQLGESVVVSIDDFIIGTKHDRSDNWRTFDRKRLINDILIPARPGISISYKQYNSGEWAAGDAGHIRTISLRKYLIIEGCGILHPLLMKYYDYSAWIDCPKPIATKRAEHRDRLQGNKDVDLWDTVWKLNDLDYFNKYHPYKLANCIVDIKTQSYIFGLLINSTGVS